MEWEEYERLIEEQMKEVKKCKCKRVRKLAMEILSQPYLELKGDCYGLVQIWCTICDDGVVIKKPAWRD